MTATVILADFKSKTWRREETLEERAARDLGTMTTVRMIRHDW